MSDTDKKVALLAVDFMSLVFLLYLPYFGIWAQSGYDPMWLNNHQQMPTPLILALADVFPFVFGLVWLLYRYLNIATQKFPFLKTYMTTPKYHVPVMFVMAMLIFMVKRFWR